MKQKNVKPDISTETGKEWTQNWRESEYFTRLNGIKAFHIPASEIIKFYEVYSDKNQFPDGVGVRIYLGLDKTIDPHSSTQIKLVFVGTDPTSQDDIILDDTVYDLSTPCPYDCDSNNSPLNGD